MLFRLFFTTFIQSNRILNDNERRYAEAGDGPHAGTACLADGDKPEASEIIESQAKTIEELRATIVELNASLAWLKRKVFGKMSEKCNPINNGDPMLPFDYGDLGQIEAEIEAARNKAAQIITPNPKSPVKLHAATGSSWTTFRS